MTGLPDSSLITGAALLLTSLVGLFSYHAQRKSARNEAQIGGASTAITGLEVLAQQHALEITRIGKLHADCETSNTDLRGRISVLEGQIDVLKTITSGAAADAVKAAAAAAKSAVDKAAVNAKNAVDTAAEDARTHLDP